MWASHSSPLIPFFKKLWLYFFGTVSRSWQNWAEGKDFPCSPCSHRHADSFVINSYPPAWNICYSLWTFTDSFITTQSLQFSYTPLLVLHLVWTWPSIWWPVSIIYLQDAPNRASYRVVSLPLTILCARPIRASLHSYPQPLATTSHFTVSIVLPFPEYHMVRNMQYVAFSG